MNDLSFIFPMVIKILNNYEIFKKRFKRIIKNNMSPRAWENLELRLQLQGKHGSSSLLLIINGILKEKKLFAEFQETGGKNHGFLQNNNCTTHENT